MEGTCSGPMSIAAAMPIIPARSTTTATTIAAYIAATTGTVMPTTATIPASGTTRDFMDGATIHGARRFTGASGRGDGEELRGLGSMVGSLHPIRIMPGRRSG